MLAQRTNAMPDNVQPVANAGLRKVIEFLDVDYGAEYLDYLDKALAIDTADRNWCLAAAAAKHLANAMSYDDPIRVADAKTRADRMQRVTSEVGAPEDAIVQITEYLHPRMEEVCDCLPKGMADWIERRPKLYAWLDRRVNKGRRVRTNTIKGYALLWLTASLRPYRRRLKRHHHEMKSLDVWYQRALDVAAQDYDLGVEVLNCRRLIKGYSDTHSRGTSKFDRVMSSLELIQGRADASQWLRRLIEAALQDENGDALDGALKTIASFAEPPGNAAELVAAQTLERN
ncbi:MAG: DUF6537 domain-containing protein [Hyphomicrobiaceae bacterium]